jgi:hypothetical protein
MADYGGLVTRSEGRLSEDEAFVLMSVSRWGSDAYPIRKLGRQWTWGPIRGIKGPPCGWKTKREAVRMFELYLDLLRERIIGAED